MPKPEFLDVNPRALHVPPSRLSGADSYKLQQQIARFGAGIAGMPPLWVYRGSDGAIMIYNGVTRATRVARLTPGTLIKVRGRSYGESAFGSPTDHRRPDTMNPEVRRQLLRVLGELSEHTPDVRFGQLLANLSYMAKSFTAEAIWDVEDEELLEAARSHLDELSARLVPSSSAGRSNELKN